MKAELILRESEMEELNLQCSFGNDLLDVEVIVGLSEPESQAIRSKAEVQYINKQVFDCIMQLQSGEASQKSVQETFEEVQRLDNQLNEIMSGCFQIREREVKKELLHVVQECKERTKAATNILRELAFTGEKLSNVHIAQLNNLAYKGVMKSGLQKKLDERAIKNQEFYKKLDDQVAKAKTGMDFKDLREKHGALVD